MQTRPFSKNRDRMALRCLNNKCANYSKYVFIHIESLLLSLNVYLSNILKVCYKWFNNQTQIKKRSKDKVKRKTII
ncbi:hypothetical protein HERIO_1492 [Hepatospora eriocheir]|uniref:Uncharacterized protein n=1 Tax=Hepatospora eriocheir TaxID=1081669 RepID=A0A1X0Q9U9_9MICR|nr:hypothetical protein HERIO_1492 [Hepatospora eriocheir]